MKKLIFVSLLAPLLVACSFASLSQSDRDYTQTHPAPKAFDPKRTQYTCATEGAARKNPCLTQSLGWMVFGQTDSQCLRKKV